MSAPDGVATDYSKLLAGLRLATPDEIEADRLVEARQEIQRLSRDIWPAVKLPSEWRKLISAPALLAFAERYQPARGSVLLVGPAGVGKTLAVRAAVRRLLRDAWTAGEVDAPIVRARWTTALDLARAIREAKFGTSCEVFHAAERAAVLVLDEVGQELADPRWLLELLDSRSARHRPTITTSGLSRAELLERYGSGAVRRLTEPLGTLLDVFPAGEAPR